MIRKGKIWLPVAMIATILWALPRMLPAVSFDSGLMEHSQPNAVTFQSRAWGNEFTWEHETADGYSIIDKAADGYWYYSILNANGDYTASNYKVGIDSPVGIEKHLRRTDPILSIINAQIDSFNLLCEDQSQEYWSYLSRDDIYLGVILVEFPDVGPSHRQCMHNTYPDEYTYAEYVEHFNSIGTYYTDLNPAITSPDGDPVFGSQRDYWSEVSRGNATMYTTIINNIVGGVPEWISYPNNLPNECSRQNTGMNWTVWNWIVDYCADEGMIPLNTQYICIVGAGNNWYYEPGLGWHLIGPVGGLGMSEASYTEHELNIIGGFTAHEKWSWWGCWFEDPPLWNKYFPNPPWVNPPYTWLFTNIGMYCHEAGHGIFGWGHITPTHEWDLMESGTCGGLGYTCSCPTHPDPVLLIEKNWVTPIVISTNEMDFQMTYEETYNTPNIYMVAGTQPSNPYQDYFVFENRRYVAFNKFGPGNPNEYLDPNPENNLLVWQQKNMPTPGGTHSYLHLQMANNATGLATQPEGCVFPGATGRDHLLPTYADLDIHDSRSTGYGYLWEGHYQDGIALKEIISDDDEDLIQCDLYRNYWEGTLGLLPGHTINNPTTLITWSGTDVVVGGDVIVPDAHTLNIAPGTVIDFQSSSRIKTEGSGTVVLWGSYSGNLYIEGNVKIYDNTTIANGATLTLYPGSIVKFVGGKKLIVNGRLVAVGTAANRIYFVRYSAGDQYECVEVDHSGLNPTQDSEIKYCTITGARVGVLARSTSKLVVEHCEIYDNIYGIYGSTTGATLAPKIRYNTIRDNSIYGIAMYGMGSSGVIAHNMISANSSGDVYLHDSDPTTYGHNDHRGPSVFGLLCESNSSPYLQISFPYSGCNQFGIGGSCDYGVIIRDESRPVMGWVSGTYWYPGNNNLYAHNQYLLDHRGNQYIWAQHNWWTGRDPETAPPLITNRDLVDTYDWLSGDPVQPDSLFSPGSGGSINEPVEQVDALPPLLLQADQLLAAGNYASAAALYLSALSSNLSIANGLWAVWGFNQASSLPGVSLPFLAQLNGISAQFASNQIGIYAQYLVMRHLSVTNPSAALAMATNLSRQNLYPELAMHSAFRAAMLNKYALGNISVANLQFEQFINAYPAEDLSNLAYLELGLLPPGIEARGDVEILIVPQEFRFDAAHPNPFNPTTILRYELPELSYVHLRIYDVAGRSVATFVDGWRDSGVHEITFDGSLLPSGIYLARLQAGEFTAVQKLVLMK